MKPQWELTPYGFSLKIKGLPTLYVNKLPNNNYKFTFAKVSKQLTATEYCTPSDALAKLCAIQWMTSLLEDKFNLAKNTYRQLIGETYYGP